MHTFLWVFLQVQLFWALSTFLYHFPYKVVVIEQLFFYKWCCVLVCCLWHFDCLLYCEIFIYIPYTSYWWWWMMINDGCWYELCVWITVLSIIYLYPLHFHRWSMMNDANDIKKKIWMGKNNKIIILLLNNKQYVFPR